MKIPNALLRLDAPGRAACRAHPVAERFCDPRNREVARRLHVSPHTVNTHLRHVFDKLGVPNRAGLAATVARHQDDDT